jgi:enoyl-CoA hydratase/carnithine racemase
MSEARLLETRDGAIVTLTLSHPGKLNAMTLGLRDALSEAFERLNRDAAVRAIVLTGADGQFSAGADIAGWSERSVQECRERLKAGGMRLMRAMVAGSKPIIAAVAGHAYGAGMALACASDHVIAASDARFCCEFTRVGFIPDMAMLYTLPNRVGPARAKQLIALAEAIDAARALQFGMADEVVEPDRLAARARELALQYAEGPPLAFELMKSALADGLERALAAELALQPYAWLSEDHEEGKRAFRERRRPKFTGR